MKRLVAMLVVAALAAAGACAGGEDESKPAEAAIRVHMISGSKEYRSEPSLKAFKEYLEKHYPIACTMSLGTDGGKDLPNLEALEEADLMLVFCRRQKISGEQLARIKKWCEAGKPVLGIRTASHAFQGYLAMDREVFGGSYKGHGGGETVQVKIHPPNKEHPILCGVEPWSRHGTLYRNRDNAEDTVLLLTGTGQKSGQAEPVAWARQYAKHKTARAFYTSMGYPHDFENENFRRMLVNAIYWTTARPSPSP